MTKVQCRCGVVEIEISAEPIVQFYCHSDDCQAVHGGALCPGIRLFRGRREGRPRRPDDMETEAKSTLHLSRMRHKAVHRCRSETAARRQWLPASAEQIPARVSCAVP